MRVEGQSAHRFSTPPGSLGGGSFLHCLHYWATILSCGLPVGVPFDGPAPHLAPPLHLRLTSSYAANAVAHEPLDGHNAREEVQVKAVDEDSHLKEPKMTSASSNSRKEEWRPSLREWKGGWAKHAELHGTQGQVHGPPEDPYRHLL